VDHEPDPVAIGAESDLGRRAGRVPFGVLQRLDAAEVDRVLHRRLVPAVERRARGTDPRHDAQMLAPEPSRSKGGDLRKRS